MDFLSRYDLGTSHPLLTQVRNAYRQMREMQQWSRDEILDFQFRHLKQLVNHASKTVPMYMKLYGGATDISNWDEFHALPELPRSLVSDTPMSERTSTELTKQTQPISFVKTSGSTGNHLETMRSRMMEVWRAACKLIEYEWMELEPSGVCVSLRFERDRNSPGWDPELGCAIDELWEGKLLASMMKFGRGYQVPLGTRGGDFAAILNKTNPDLIYTTPTNLESAVPYLNNLSPKLLLTIGEPLYEGTRMRLSDNYRSRVYDLYGANELGRIAGECPRGDGYHVHDANVVLEVVDDKSNPIDLNAKRANLSHVDPNWIESTDYDLDDPCGYVLATTLRNPGMPLIRYRIGDLSTLPLKKCGCGMNLTHFARVDGREINRLVLKSGRRESAYCVVRRLANVKSLREFRLRQVGFDEVILEMSNGSSIGTDDLRQVNAILEYVTGEEMKITARNVEAIPKTAAGKLPRVIVDIETE